MARSLRSTLLTAVLLLVVAGAHLGLLAARQTWPVVSGDEGTFLAMTASLALDGDLSFSAADRARLEQGPPGGRRAVILQRTGDGIAYSKPAIYPLLAAPWYRLFGEVGPLLLNACALVLALAAAWAYLRRRVGQEDPGRVIVWFAGTGVLVSYVVWSMSDSLQASMVLGGGALALAAATPIGADGARRVLDSPLSTAVGGVLLGLAAAMRYPNALLVAGLALALFVGGRRRRAVLVAVAASLAFFAGLGANRLLAGAPVPYKAVRATFNEESGYPAGDGAQLALPQFDEARATHSLGLVPGIQPRLSAFAAGYFLFGRHTGLLLYFPAALALVWAVVRRRDPVGVTLLATVAALALFYVVWMPRNYFGGATFLGNRYFLTGYALLLLAPLRLPGRRSTALVWVLASATFVSALASSLQTRSVEQSSQTHAYAGIFRLLPYESTASDIDGRRDRYWSDELVRFVDPWAKVGEHGFTLRSDAPPAELLVASGREHGVVRFLVQANVPEVDVVYRDWLGERRFRLRAERGTARGFIEIATAPALRKHPYWWDPSTPLFVRAMRLAVETPDGSSAKADLRYAGPYRFTPRFYSGRLDRLRIPARIGAAESRRLPVRIRNAGNRYWASRDSIPVLLGYRVYESPRADGSPIAIGPFTRLTDRVAPGELLESRLDFVAPSAEGRYEVVVDLVIGGVAWFEEWNGSPVATRTITVGAQQEPDEASAGTW